MGGIAAGSRKTLYGLLLCLGIALIFRLLAFHLFSQVTDLHGDENYYYRVAKSIADGDGHPRSQRGPLYPAFMAVFFLLSEEGSMAVRSAQIVLSLFTVMLIFDIVRRRYGRRPAIYSGLLCAFSPSLSHYAHFLWSEELAAFLIVLMFWLFERSESFKRARAFMLPGMAVGLLALCRTLWFHFLPLALLWTVWPLRRSFRPAASRAAFLVLGTALFVAPWSIRNSFLHGHVVFLSTDSWRPIMEGNVYPEKSWRYKRGKYKEHLGIARAQFPRDPIGQDGYFRRTALGEIRRRQPLWLARNFIVHMGSAFSPRTQSVRFLRLGWIEGLGRTKAALLVLYAWIGRYLILFTGILGLWLTGRDRVRTLTLLALAFKIMIHTVSIATARYLVPMIPLLCLYGGVFIEMTLSGGILSSRWRLAGGLLTVLFVASLVFLNRGEFAVAWAAAMSGL